MQEPLYIDTDAPLSPGLDFYFLRSEGIKYIQELTGSFWTDFNEHDPGVTILDQLCYALTDLSYRTEFDIQDHFYNNKKDDFTFLKPNEIFPCNALTINDYRKLVFDSVFELNNVWVLPLDNKSSSINGLYKILLDINETVKDEDTKLGIVTKTRDIFCDNRNICEDLEQIKILNHLSTSIHANIEVDGIRDIESILAKVYYRVNEYLSPEIKFYSMEELLNEDYPIHEIFNGPLLKHGFIKSTELYPKPNKILISEIIKIIMQVEGVMSVKNLYLKIGNKIYENQIDIGEEDLPKLITNLNSKADQTVFFYRGSVQYSTIDLNLVKRKLNELLSANKRVYRLSEETIKIPEGESIELEEYFSIQNDFPVVYGIGPYGIPNDPDTKRKAKAKQLKGYLLLFEQIMANYLSQLAHSKDLFSLNNDTKQTYFYQDLNVVPDVKPLYKQEKNKSADDSGFAEYKKLTSYQSGLPELVKMKDNYTDRRNRFLDYLLATHGESYTQYSLSQFNYYFDELEFEKHLIQNKTRLLKSLSTINKNRAKAFNYKKPSLDTDNITGLEAKISLLLGLGIGFESDEKLNGYTAHSLTNAYKSHGLKLIKASATKYRRRVWDQESKFKDDAITNDYIEINFDHVDKEDVELTQYSEEQKRTLLEKTIPFRSKMVTELFFREGINIVNYKIGPLEKDGTTLWYVAFKHPSEEDWFEIAQYESDIEANAAVQALIFFLKELNIETEGVHIVEHMLMRPDLSDQRYGIFMMDSNGKPLLRSTDVYTFEERRKVIEELKDHIRSYDNYSVEATKDKDFEVYFKTSDGKHTLISVEAKPSVEETHEDMEQLYMYMSDQNNIIPFYNKIGLYIRYSDKYNLIPEDFFSYRASVLIPTWTARFSNKEFRSIAEDTIQENSPANVSLQILWVDPEEMEEIEDIYYEWEKEKATAILDKEKLNELNNRMANLLIQLKDEDSKK